MTSICCNCFNCFKNVDKPCWSLWEKKLTFFLVRTSKLYLKLAILTFWKWGWNVLSFKKEGVGSNWNPSLSPYGFSKKNFFFQEREQSPAFLSIHLKDMKISSSILMIFVNFLDLLTFPCYKKIMTSAQSRSCQSL